MKKLLLLSVAAVFLSTAAWAQLKEQDKNMKKDYTEWDKKVKDDLKMTSEQAAKYDALNKEYKEKIDALMADANLNKDVQKEKKMALKKEKEAKFLEILTADQQVKYKEMVESKKKEMPAKQ